MRTGNEIRADYTEADYALSGIVGEWLVPGTQHDLVMQYRYPSRFHKEYAKVDGSPQSVTHYTDGDSWRTHTLRREDQGDGSHIVTYLFEQQRDSIIG